MSSQTSSAAGRPLTLGAVAVMLVLCLSWGFNQIAVKLALPDIPPLMMATMRSIGGLIIVLAKSTRPFHCSPEREEAPCI